MRVKQCVILLVWGAQYLYYTWWVTTFDRVGSALNSRHLHVVCNFDFFILWRSICAIGVFIWHRNLRVQDFPLVFRWRATLDEWMVFKLITWREDFINVVTWCVNKISKEHRVYMFCRGGYILMIGKLDLLPLWRMIETGRTERLDASTCEGLQVSMKCIRTTWNIDIGRLDIMLSPIRVSWLSRIVCNYRYTRNRVNIRSRA